MSQTTEPNTTTTPAIDATATIKTVVHITPTSSVTTVASDSFPVIQRGHPVVAKQRRNKDWKGFISKFQLGDCFDLTGGQKEAARYYHQFYMNNKFLSRTILPGGAIRMQFTHTR